MCALSGGRSVEASWGFSALDGLPMGTRPGRLDPGVILYLLQVKRMSVEQVQDLLYHECGLKGLSGVSSDVRGFLASEDPRARLAVDFFSLRCARMATELATVMGGLDGFTSPPGSASMPRPSAPISDRGCPGWGRRDRRGGQCPTRATHLLEQQPRRLLCHTNERGTHDRASCPGTGSPVSRIILHRPTTVFRKENPPMTEPHTVTTALSTSAKTPEKSQEQTSEPAPTALPEFEQTDHRFNRLLA